MKGQVVAFSLSQGVGKIVTSTNKEVLFSFAQWMSNDLPKIGQDVDFDINQHGHAVMVTSMVRNAWSLELVG